MAESAEQFASDAPRIVPRPVETGTDDEESPDVWGFRDTRFFINERGNVELSGARYELSGSELPALLPWVEGVMRVRIDRRDVDPSSYPPAVPEPRIEETLRSELESLFGPQRISFDAEVRLRRGHGHTQEEMWEIKHSAVGRVPDVVVWPTTEPEVEALVQAASRHRACLIPYGGGTNVTNALRCPEGETRTIVSVDMRRMNRVLWIDAENRMARIGAGAAGREIMAQLAEHGFTMGHEPDSVEFSTLGGWIATHASGMKKNRYGNIEDLVLDVRVVTCAGILERPGVSPRESAGPDPRRWILGSEGTLGIITSAVVKLFPLPEVQAYDSVLFPSFEKGVAFMYDLQQQGDVPASVRLVDNLQFQFGMALRPATPPGWPRLKSRMQKWWVTRLRGFEPERMVICTLVFEGSRSEVSRQQSRVRGLAGQHGGMRAGAENGRRGYQLTFGIAYIRDFIMNHHVIGESFETSVPWSKALELVSRVKARIRAEHERRSLPGRPFVSARVTQIYPTGVCVYFYSGFYYKGVDRPSEVYAEIEEAARREILACGGSLSHHHGVGKLRQGFLSDVASPAVLEWHRRTKRAVDPDNLFGANNLGLDGGPDQSRAGPRSAE